MDDVIKLVEVETTIAGRAEVIIDAQPSQFSDGYSIILTPSEALRLAHAIVARVSDVRTQQLAVPMLVPTLQVAA
ncbi:hypothetical protein I8920_03890 [Curtobacterium sp. YC1]|uniref:hypothetical protein n=1 Tax=Curtobacterium sp. YC1 TaxID=2795488 RepID=UPI0018E563D6|nr:hypothetical protein [Curtobacterium sp. YC1]QQD76909.1 hypothetical protein I8920_03890 [Curtobacterium sp. YC1]